MSVEKGLNSDISSLILSTDSDEWLLVKAGGQEDSRHKIETIKGSGQVDSRISND
jgi:hypothetical protein